MILMMHTDISYETDTNTCTGDSWAISEPVLLSFVDTGGATVWSGQGPAQWWTTVQKLIYAFVSLFTWRKGPLQWTTSSSLPWINDTHASFPAQQGISAFLELHVPPVTSVWNFVHVSVTLSWLKQTTFYIKCEFLCGMWSLLNSVWNTLLLILYLVDWGHINTRQRSKNN